MKYFGSYWLLKPTFFMYPFKQLAISTVLHNNINLAVLTNGLVNLGNIGVQDGSLEVSLTLNEVIWLPISMGITNLDSHCLSGEDMGTFSYSPKSANSKRFTYIFIISYEYSSLWGPIWCLCYAPSMIFVLEPFNSRKPEIFLILVFSCFKTLIIYTMN